MDISVLLATYNRRDLLYRTLESFCFLDTKGLNWEVLVVDNADDIKTRQTVEKFRDRLPIKYLLEIKTGKNNALNHAIPEAQGALFVFTDDDIIADGNWLVELWEGAKRWPNYSVFGGKIHPEFPPNKMIPIPKGHPFFKGAYAFADWDIEEGPYRAQDVWGANMAIRSKIFNQGWRFNPALGPCGKKGIWCDEIEFTIHLQNAGFRSVYLPKSLVHHQIRPEQLGVKWLYSRAFRVGRGEAQIYGYPNVTHFFGVPRYLFRELIETGIKRLIFSFSRKEAVDLGINYWGIMGRIYQFRKGLK